MNPGDLVMIRLNPHHPAAINLIGKVVRFRPNAGAGATDLVDVEYRSPKTGESYVMPFGTACLDPASPTALRALAEHHEAVAAELRELARAAEAQP